MIVPMKKVTVLVHTTAAEEALTVLRNLGVVHVTTRTGTSTGTSEIEERIDRAERALGKIGTVPNPETLLRLPCRIVDEILELSERRERLLVSREELDAKLARYARWSNVSLKTVRELGDAGVDIRLYTASRAQYTALAAEPLVYKVDQVGKTVLVAQIVTDGSAPELDLSRERLPDEPRRDLLDQHYRVDEKLVEVEGRLRFLGNYHGVLQEWREGLLADLEFARVQDSLQGEGSVCHLQGYIPEDAAKTIRTTAAEEGWGYMLTDPGEDDTVPTLIRNPAWVRIIDPVMKFLGTVPGYRELDVSLWFLLFFALFVAILVGDAGYGLIYLLGTLLARRKFSNARPEPFILMYVLSACTILWGVLSGTYFGSEIIANLPVLSHLVIPAISSYDLGASGFNDNQFILIRLCFQIGAVHLTLAHALALTKLSPSPKALGELGWIAIIWGLYGVTGTLVIGNPFSPVSAVLVGVGSVVALCFTNYQKNIFKGIGQTLIDFPLSLIGGFSDIVSYLRLFAVGYTSLVLASTFNSMAANIGIIGPLAGIEAALILFFGHSLNLVLAGMGVVVHGIRLEMLEFSGHVGNEWSGEEYKPFKERALAAPPA